MKAIVSHDIDHIHVTEHLTNDLIVPKFLARMHIELFSGKISSREYILRWSDFFKNKWQNIDELITFNNVNGVPSSFFIGVNKGLGLNYSNVNAAIWINQMQQRKCEIGIHGIEYNDVNGIKNEFELFKELTRQNDVGMRMHYVRNTPSTMSKLAAQGYLYDSTEHAFKDPYKIGNMWEFPFQIMDGWIIENGKKWQSRNFPEAKDQTMKLIEKAQKMNLKYLGIDFHDRYFSHSFNTWLKWYMWTIEYLKENKIEFINFSDAIKELNNEDLAR